MKGPFAGPKRAPREPDWLPRKLRVLFRGGPEGEFVAEVDPHAEYWNRVARESRFWPDGERLFDLDGLPSVTMLHKIDIYRREVYACTKRTGPDMIWNPLARVWIRFVYVFASRSG